MAPTVTFWIVAHGGRRKKLGQIRLDGNRLHVDDTVRGLAQQLLGRIPNGALTRGQEADISFRLRMAPEKFGSAVQAEYRE